MHQIGGWLAGADAGFDQIEDFFLFVMRHPGGTEYIETIGRQMQGLADEECGFRKRVGGPVGKYELRRLKLRHRVAHMVENRREFLGARREGPSATGAARFGHWNCSLARPGYSAACRCFAQRSAAASSADLASTQTVPSGRSSCFQNGARVLR